MEIKDLRTKVGKVGVLMGGPSSERDISLKSGQAVLGALMKAGLDAVSIDIPSANVKEVTDLIKSFSIGCAFVALHGRFGEDGQIQRILDTLKIPYTGSEAMACKIAIDKIACHEIFEVNGIAVANYKPLHKGFFTMNMVQELPFPYPVVVKPATQGSSIGLSVVDRYADLEKAINAAFRLDENVLIEQFVPGRELTVAILDNAALPVIEIVPKNRVFDFESKYQAGAAEYILPARLEAAQASKVQEVALTAHRMLGCSGFSRVDLILTADNVPVMLEVNAIPGLTEFSLVPKAAQLAGISFEQLCIRSLELAYEKASKKLGVAG